MFRCRWSVAAEALKQRLNARVQVALGIIKAAEKHLLAMDDMEEMVEFMKTEVPNWDMQRLQARAYGQVTTCGEHPALC